MPIKNSLTDKIAFVIPTFTNTTGLIAVLKDTEKYYGNSFVILVNNDGSVPLENKIDVNSFHLKLSVLNNPKNQGFARAVNDGVRRAKELAEPKYLIMLNDDIRFKEDWVAPCIDAIGKNSWAAAVPLLISKTGIVENYGYKVLPYGKVELLKSPGKNPDGLTAAAVVFKTDDFFKLRGFDPVYFAYLEDVDLFLRATRLGMKFGIVNETKVVHEGQKTSSKFRVKKAYLDFRNWIILIAKNWGFKKTFLNFPQIFMERLRNLWGIVKSI